MRILYWNIQNFAWNKWNDADINAVLGQVFFPAGFGGAPSADIYVVVEVTARNTPLGDVPVGGGATGLNALVQAIQATHPNYLCVPPVSTADGGGQAEAVGVIYDSAQLRFDGPEVWSNFGPVPLATIGVAPPPAPWNALSPLGAAFANAAYPVPWNGAPFNGVGDPAPQVHYPNAANTAFIEFPNAGRRRPLRCWFTDIGSGDMLDLWIVHSPPYASAAGNALLQLTTVPDIQAAPAANEIRIICGDFNLNTRNPYQFGLYAPITGAPLNYIQKIGGVGQLPRNTPTSFANPCNFNTYYINGLAIDNFLTLGMPAGAVHVIDMVAGTPAPPFVTQLNNPLAAYAAMAGNPTHVFRSWANFGHIGNRPASGSMNGARGASDHLPLSIDF